ncbi:MAG: immunoglobulin-like domain-containing protein [Christensenellales bacterium]
MVRVTGSSFTADKTGKWTITYYALDAYGNTATETRTVTVK